MNLGPLNRNGVMFRDYPTVEVGGIPRSSLRKVSNLPLTVGDVTVKDDLVAMRDASTQTATFTTRYLALAPAGRYVLDFEGRRYTVESARELGRREGLVLKCTQSV